MVVLFYFSDLDVVALLLSLKVGVLNEAGVIKNRKRTWL